MTSSMTIEPYDITKDYTMDLARQLNIPVTKVTLVAGQLVGCLDVHLLKISSQGKVSSTLLYQSDINNLVNGTGIDRLEMKIRSALIKLRGER